MERGGTAIQIESRLIIFGVCERLKLRARGWGFNWEQPGGGQIAPPLLSPPTNRPVLSLSLVLLVCAAHS